ncbi:GTP pyrophosphokinase [Gracilibacillus boraciitolerans JCM 21714]|uniref:GTP pyrophosphokinase n=1 Tax=Gracilibacillus boraciitolerans JCM 21714 TaxID=1298598 RepID=W4VLU6_9BACI|nr:GTP pyrophosphokinase [Gracilibacillus boraciitolerans JCM 21714]
MESLKVDLFSDMVYVFTPKGDVIELPRGSVPIDFAYKIHTEVGNHSIGAKINGKMEPLDYQLKNGDIVEMMTSKHSYGPSQDWLKMTQTSQAKNKIKQFFKKQRRDENVIKGREMVEAEIRQAGFTPKDVLTEENVVIVLEKFNFSSEEDMFAAVGYHGITPAQIVTRLTEKIRAQQEKNKNIAEKIEEVNASGQSIRKKSKRDSGVRVEGVDNMLIRLSKCCNPVPGDEIIGYITKGRGVSVHRKDCPNVQPKDAENRLIFVEWENDVSESKSYHVDLEISGFDRRGLLNDVLQVINESKTNIIAVSGKSDRNKIALIHVSILIHNINHLRRIVERLKQIQDVYTVERTIQ